ncbi:hypothetical protein SUGI_1036900 [Cryptomeria japonica]|nr:hypothetical protein SUGI_1036900 [Cryptomeria japonica]
MAGARAGADAKRRTRAKEEAVVDGRHEERFGGFGHQRWPESNEFERVEDGSYGGGQSNFKWGDSMEQEYPMENFRARVFNGWQAYGNPSSDLDARRYGLGRHQTRPDDHIPQWVFEKGRWVDKLANSVCPIGGIRQPHHWRYATSVGHGGEIGQEMEYKTSVVKASRQLEPIEFQASENGRRSNNRRFERKGYQNSLNGWFRKGFGKGPGKDKPREERELGGSGIVVDQKEKGKGVLIEEEGPSKEVEKDLGKLPTENPFSINIDEKDIQTNKEFLSKKAIFIKWGGLSQKDGEDIRVWCHEQWGKKVDVRPLANKFHLVSFDSHEEKTKALSKGPWFLHGIQMHIIDWTPNFDPWSFVISESSVWFRLYNLPPEYWSDDIIKDIGRRIGKYTFKDSPLVDQKWGLYFKNCVKVASEMEFPEEIELVSESIMWKVTIKCEEKLDFALTADKRIAKGVSLSEVEKELIESIWPEGKMSLHLEDPVREVGELEASEIAQNQTREAKITHSEPLPGSGKDTDSGSAKDDKSHELGFMSPQEQGIGLEDLSLISSKTRGGEIKSVEGTREAKSKGDTEENGDSDLKAEDSFEDFQDGIMEARGLEQI